LGGMYREVESNKLKKNVTVEFYSGYYKFWHGYTQAISIFAK